MSLLDVLDATRLCSSGALADPAAWAMPLPTFERAPAADPSGRFSWSSLVRNPRAILVTGVVGGAVAVDAAVRIVAAALTLPRY